MINTLNKLNFRRVLIACYLGKNRGRASQVAARWPPAGLFGVPNAIGVLPAIPDALYFIVNKWRNN
jgi:hypothetical protein